MSAARVSATAALVAIFLAMSSAPAAADRAPDPAVIVPVEPVGRRLVIDTARHRYATPLAKVSPTIYLERCNDKGDGKGPGCMILTGNNDARTNTSSIPTRTSMVSEFANVDRQTGANADEEWAQIVQCMREVYSPYNVTVTDVKPTGGASYHQALIAGKPGEVGLKDGNILGVAPLTSDCSAIDNVISFTFSNQHTQTSVTDRVLNICWTAAQESAHAFGLDHEYSFSGDRSACNDPMTYRTDCGGQKFFRNETASCGEDTARPCKCGASQNSHLKILSVFGSGMSIAGNPSVEMTSPRASDATLGRGITVRAGAKRGVARIELLFNGHKWAELPGAAFARTGQPNPSSYSALVPTDLPDSIVDVKVVAYDDLGASTESAVVTVTKVAACSDAKRCAAGQKCEAGKCFWDPAAGEIGDSCTYPQFCKTGLCTGTADDQICTQECVPGAAESCPSGLTCVMSSADAGVCFFTDSGGCCSVDRSGSAGWVPGGLAALVLGLVMRRRRR